ncbi:MAG: amidohydrolase [bacterium]|nr:amidohydrolase [bacterium]
MLTETTERVVEWRRAIHRHPEPGFEEQRTAELIERVLGEAGIEHRRLAKTGVVGVVRGAHPGRVAGLRADMDCLTLEERSGEPFASERQGLMHACGHDAHVAMLLGAASALARERANLHGSVVCIFQPAEEGPGGAKPMIAEGCLDDPKVEAIAMLHVDPRLDTGTVGITAGPTNAATDELRIEIRGVGGHGAHPHRSVDAIPAAANVVLALQNVVARETDPLGSVVVTIGTLEGGYRQNIIADRVKMSGTIRTLDANVRTATHQKIERIAEHAAAAYGCTASVELGFGYPALVNEPALTRAFAAYLKPKAPELRVLEDMLPSMGGEDFSFYAERIPAVACRLGVRNEAIGATAMIHSPEFKLDEAALEIGVKMLTNFARGFAAGEFAAPR